jgi:hypothetical protein
MRELFAVVEGLRGNERSSQVWKGANPADALTRAMKHWEFRPFPNLEMGFFILNGI